MRIQISAVETMLIMKPLVTIVIPNFNGGEFLEECLTSALGQDYTNFEIIVIDDGSTDNSLTVIDPYLTRIKLITSQNRSASHARNLGIKAARGDFIAFLDSDDIWIKSKLTIQMSLATSENADLVFCGFLEFGERHQVYVPNQKLNGNITSYFLKFPGVNLIGSCSGVLIRKSLLGTTGLFDEAFRGTAEDWDFFRRYCKVGVASFSKEILYLYRKHSSSITFDRNLAYYTENKRAVLKMLNEENELTNFRKRMVWVKFHWGFFKGFARKREPKNALKVAARSLKRIC